MDHYDDLLYDGYQTDDAFEAGEYNTLVRILDTQVVGALHGIGDGVIEGGEVTDGSGLQVDVSAFAAIIETEHGHCYAERPADASLTLPDDMTVYVWAVALLPDDGDYDSRQSGVVRFQYSQTDTQPTNGIPLATVTTASGAIDTITDTRSLVPGRQAADLASSIADLEDAVGIPYTDGADDLDARVTDLEDGATGGGGYNYWRNMPKAPGDTTTVTQEAEDISGDAVDDHEEEYHSEDAGDTDETETATEPWDVDAVNQARALLRATLAVDPDAPEDQVDAPAIVWDVYGEGNGLDAQDYVDRTNSTWLPA